MCVKYFVVSLELLCSPELYFVRWKDKWLRSISETPWLMKASGEIAVCEVSLLSSQNAVFIFEILWSDPCILNLTKNQDGAIIRQSLAAHTQEVMLFTILHWCYCVANLAITGSLSLLKSESNTFLLVAVLLLNKYWKVLGPYALAVCDQHIVFPGYDQHCHVLSWSINPLESIIKQAHMVLVSVCLPFISVGFPPLSDITDVDFMVNLPGSQLVCNWIWVSQRNLTSGLGKSWIAVW